VVLWPVRVILGNKSIDVKPFWEKTDENRDNPPVLAPYPGPLPAGPYFGAMAVPVATSDSPSVATEFPTPSMRSDPCHRTE
jgi:hypothetical protein